MTRLIQTPKPIHLFTFAATLQDTSDKLEVEAEPEKIKKHLLVVCSSDRGLCGAIHSSICKAVKATVAGNEEKSGLDTKIVVIGDKARSIIQRTLADKMLFSVNDIGKRNVTFLDASTIANSILESGFEFDSGSILYNRFK